MTAAGSAGGSTPFEMPALFTSSDTYAANWQRMFLRLQRIQLWALVVAAIGGATTWEVQTFRASAFVTALALVIALSVRLYTALRQPERKWYDGRAAAESIRNLSWKYTQRAEPFASSLTQKQADDLFASRVRDVLGMVPTLDVGPASGAKQITDGMRALRARTLRERQSIYLQDRIDHQVSWYSGKAQYNSGRANFWNFAVAVLEMAAIIFALVRLSGGTDFDFPGIIATSSAAAVAWLQSRQHATLAQSYAVTAQELAAVRATLEGSLTEAEWAELVEQAEEAMSREHTLWKASRR